jgi:hypothetical protein
MDVSELTINAFTTSNPLNRSILPPILARSTTLELRDEYRQTGRYVRYGSKDHWIRNYSLAPYIALAGTGTIIVIAVNDDDSGIYSDSDDENGSEFGAAVDKIVADRPELDWRRHDGYNRRDGP